MKKIFLLLILLLLSLPSNAEIIEAGVSIDEVPQFFFGIWRVNGKLDKTNSLKTFRPQGVDFWNLSRDNDKITLNNPNTGATAEISVDTVEGNLVIFTKKTHYDNNKVLTDTVHMRIDGDKFSGINNLKLESFSLIDNHLMKTETAQYFIDGEKLSGQSIFDK